MIHVRRTSSMFVNVAFAVGAMLTTFAPAALAQKAVSEGEAVTATVTVMAIDFQGRLVTLKDKDGYTETVYAGPEVQRFDALKVGDKVTFRYHESVVYAIQKPGTTPQPVAGGDVVASRSPGSKPGGTVSRQMTATVTVEAIDLKIPSVTILMADGSRSSFKVENKKNLDGVKAGDRVQITYTQALAVSVQAPEK
jgi:Cu/Ag efflux protein CusF